MKYTLEISVTSLKTFQAIQVGFSVLCYSLQYVSLGSWKCKGEQFMLKYLTLETF